MRKTLLSILFCAFVAVSISAQTTAFTYQGSLKDGASPATGNYDFEFKLFDLVSAGAQQGSTLQRLNVAVASGIFTVSLDFGAAVLPGSDRFIEIGLRVNGNPGGFQQLLPRQKLASSPYSVKSLNSTNADTATNATQLGGVAANQYVVTTDPRMTNARPPTAGSSDYIQNQNAGPQAKSNFNISGTGTGNIFNVATRYEIGGEHVLSNAGANNLFAGIGAGQANSTGTSNAFFGRLAGFSNTTGISNAFFGRDAGFSNTTGDFNAFFGRSAGSANTTGNLNAFFGASAGLSNTTGGTNAFFGSSAGLTNTTGSNNAFFGRLAGDSNTTGDNNTVIGVNADVVFGNLNFATAIGAGAIVANSDMVVLGRPADTVRVPGSFASAGPVSTNGNLLVLGTSALGGVVSVTGGTDVEPGSGGYLVAGSTASTNVTIDDNEIMARNGGGTETLFLNADGGDVNLISTGTGNVGIGIATTAQDKLHVDGIIRVTGLGAAGATSLCRNASLQISTCSSSLRYKTNINRFGLGLNLINQLKPITFDWKDGGMHDLGLGAEDVAAIEPLLVTYNDKGLVEGVKYDRIGVVLVNAVKEQQKIIETQQAQIDALRKLVCLTNKDAEICREK